MDVITLARQLGKELQRDDRYLNLRAANAANDASGELQERMERFGAVRQEINRELMNDPKDEQKLKEMDADMRALYSEIMSMPEMEAYTTAKSEMEGLLSFIQQILTGSANGLDPDTIEQQEGCGGNCGSCGGCS